MFLDSGMTLYIVGDVQHCLASYLCYLLMVDSFFLVLILRIWESLLDVTCCRSLIIVYDGGCILQIGFAAESSSIHGEAVSVDANKLMQGSLCQGLMKSAARECLFRSREMLFFYFGVLSLTII